MYYQKGHKEILREITNALVVAKKKLAYITSGDPMGVSRTRVVSVSLSALTICSISFKIE
jgi:hypothetical protein